jgi:hypothetical protein
VDEGVDLPPHGNDQKIALFFVALIAATVLTFWGNVVRR